MVHRRENQVIQCSGLGGERNQRRRSQIPLRYQGMVSQIKQNNGSQKRKPNHSALVWMEKEIKEKDLKFLSDIKERFYKGNKI